MADEGGLDPPIVATTMDWACATVRAAATNPLWRKLVLGRVTAGAADFLALGAEGGARTSLSICRQAASAPARSPRSSAAWPPSRSMARSHRASGCRRAASIARASRIAPSLRVGSCLRHSRATSQSPIWPKASDRWRALGRESGAIDSRGAASASSATFDAVRSIAAESSSAAATRAEAIAVDRSFESASSRRARPALTSSRTSGFFAFAAERTVSENKLVTPALSSSIGWTSRTRSIGGSGPLSLSFGGGIMARTVLARFSGVSPFRALSSPWRACWVT